MCANPMLQRQMLAPAQLLGNVPARNFAASEKELKQRMKTVSNIGKITKAMKMVATAKVKQDLARLIAGKNFGVSGVDMFFASDKYMKDRAPAPSSDPSELLVPITSDKGMCGSINSGIIRDVRDYINRTGRAKKTIFSLGDKGTVGMQRPMHDLLKTAIYAV